MYQYTSVWFTLTETEIKTEMEISINGKILIPLTETKKITKNGNGKIWHGNWNLAMSVIVRFRFRCISASWHHTGFM